MGECKDCEREMMEADSCSFNRIIIDDKKPMIHNFTDKSPEEYIKLLREGGIIKF